MTGAASGIGRELAVQLADRGSTGLALCDVDADGLEETARLIRRKLGRPDNAAMIEVMLHTADVSGLISRMGGLAADACTRVSQICITAMECAPGTLPSGEVAIEVAVQGSGFVDLWELEHWPQCDGLHTNRDGTLIGVVERPDSSQIPTKLGRWNLRPCVCVKL